ncbi:hypothetical protein CR513_04504, partial [Mucuna pruriens]
MSQDENSNDTPEPPPDQLKWSNKERQSSTMYTFDEYVTLIDGEEPKCYHEAMESEERQNGWPNGKKVLENRWIYKIKQDSNYAYPRYKARLVRKGVDFNEIFSPMVKMSSIRIVLSLETTLDLKIEHMDVNTTFIHGDLEEEIYMKQP